MKPRQGTPPETAPASVNAFSGVKVFCATLPEDRANLGDRIADWLQAAPSRRVVDKQVLQSSDDAFHCLTVVLFYVDDGAGG